MNRAVILVLILATPISAADVEVRATNVRMTWGRKGDFSFKLYQIGYAHYFGDFGVRAMVGESDTQLNDGEYVGVDAKLEDFWALNAHRRVRLGHDYSVQLGINYTEYKEQVDGVRKPDTSLGYGVALQKRVTSSASVKLSYDNYYQKPYKGGGIERTHGVGLSAVLHY